MKKAVLAIILLMAVSVILISCNGVSVGINFYVDGELYDGVSTEGGETIEMPDNPEKEGYVFQGWFWDEGTWTQPFTASSLLNQPVSEALRVYAYFISEAELAATRLVTFETMGAGVVNPMRIGVGATIPQPQGLSRPGYYLVGWYREADFTTKWNFATDKVTADMTLYAKWVSSNDMAGAEIIAGDMVINGRNADIRIPNASATFSFSEHITVSPYAVYGIYTDQACTAEIPSGIVDVNIGNNVFYIMVTSGNGSNKSIYTANVYRRHMYNVKYIYNNGISDKSITVEEDSLLTYEDPGTKTGYTFAGWSDWNFDIDRVSENVVIQAQWTANEYDITFDSAMGSAVPQATVTYNEEYTWSVPERRGYTFLGWSDGEKMLTDASGASLSVWNVAENTAVVAVWEVIEYSVSYENLKGAANPNVVKYTVEDEITFAAVSKDGYTFVEWLDEEGSAIEGISKGSIGNRVISAAWELIGYTATFVADGVKVADIPFNVETVSVTEPEIPAKTGYTAEWEDYSFIARDITINAVYTPIIYKVIYNVAGEYDVDTPVNTNPTSYTIEDETITLVPAEKTGYTFVKWTEGGEDITEIAAGSHGDITVTAVWEAIEYTITYVDAPVNTNATGYTVETATFALTDPEKTGYDFVNWTESGSAITEIAQGSYGDKTITANWDVIVYTITYTGVTGEYDVDTPVNTNPTSYTIEDETITFVPAEKTGYTFVKWTEGGEDITEIAAGSHGDITVTAVWETVTYTLDMVMENDEGGYDGHYDGEENRTSFTVEDEFTFIEPVCDIRGYEFMGWYTLKNDGDKIEGIALGTVGNKTYYARWQRSEYTIVYRNTENAVNGNPTSYNVESETFTLVNPSKTGYTFAGWYSDADLSVVADTTVETNSIGNLAFYAKWTPTVYTVTYVLYDGTNSGSNPASYTIEDEITLAAATKAGYSFGGWFTDSAFENAIDKIALGSTGNMTLYAKWYYTGTVTFETNGGSTIEPITQEYGTVLNAPEDPDREHYIFAGWYSDEDLLTEYVFGTMPDVDFTLYAKWTAVEYNITYVLNGGENGLNPDVYTVESAFDFAPATKTGYTFVAWYTLPDFTSAPVSSIAAGTFGDMTLYANYSINSYTISFDSAGGSAVTSITQEYNTAVSAPAAPSRNGYSFNGWLTEEGEAFVFDRIPAYDVALTADWELIEYTITYNLGGGVNGPSNPDYYTIEDETVTFAAPTRRGYAFIGWFTDGDYTEEITEIPTGSYGEVEIHAKWEIIIYEITYVGVDGLDNPNPSEYTVEDDITFADIFRLGYTYHGLYAESEFQTVVTGIPQGTIGDVTVYAKYTVNTYTVWLDGKDEADYTVSFDLGGGEGDITAQHIVGDIALEYPAIPERSGYLFGGWYQTEDCTGNVYDFTSSVRSDITLYAKWIEISNTAITIGDSVSVSIEGTTLHYYDFVPLVSGDISVTTTGTVDTFGYLYDGDGTLLRSNDDGSDGTNFLIKYNVTAGEKYTIAFRGYGKASGGESVLYLSGNNTVAAGGTAAESGIMREITFGTSFTLPVPEAREGYVFRGWADAEGTMYTDAEGNSIRVFDKGEETVFVSMWEVDGFDITFVTNGGTAVETVTIPRGGRVDINSFVTTRSGYSFLGWYLSASDSEPYNATVMPDHDFTLYAKWTAYALNAIKFDESMKAISALRDVTAEDFGATCFDTDGNIIAIAVTISGELDAGQTVTARLTASANGKTKTATITDVKVYGLPTLDCDDQIDYFNLVEGLSADWFAAVGTDTYGEPTAINVYVEGEYGAGDIVTVTIAAVDVAGNIEYGYIHDVKVYGTPEIQYNELAELSFSYDGSQSALGATATDSFGKELVVNTFIVNKLYVNQEYRFTSSGYYRQDKEALFFDVEEDGTYTFYHDKRNNSGSSWAITFVVYNVTDGTIIKSVSNYGLRSQSFEFDVKANKTYCIKIGDENRLNYSSATVTIYLENSNGEKVKWYRLGSYMNRFSGYTTTDGEQIAYFSANDTTNYNLSVSVGARSVIKIYDYTDNTTAYSNTSFTGSIKNIAFKVTQGHTYQIAIRPYGGETDNRGNFTVTVSDGTRSIGLYNAIYPLDDKNNAQTGQSTSTYDYVYFMPLKDEELTFYCQTRTGGGSSTYYASFILYNLTTGSTIKSFNNISYSSGIKSITFSAKAGEIYRIRISANNAYISYSTYVTKSDGSYVVCYNDKLTFESLIAGQSTMITMLAIDSKGNMTRFKVEAKVYGLPTISEPEHVDFRVSEEITPSSLGVVAQDSYDNELDVELQLQSGEHKAGQILTYLISAVDSVGNVATKAIEVKLYGDIIAEYGLEGATEKSLTADDLQVKAYDSFNNKLDVKVTLVQGSLIAGQTVTFNIHAVDLAGNIYNFDREYRVYSVDDIQLEYNAWLTDKIKLTSKGEEFTASATDSFGEACVITVERAGGGAIVAGEVQNIVIVATDRAGNRYVSDVIAGISVYDMPVITYSHEYDYILSSEIDSVDFLFTAADSFGAELYVSLEVLEQSSDILKLKASAEDNAGNITEEIYELEIVEAGSSYIVLVLTDGSNTLEIGTEILTVGSGYTLPFEMEGVENFSGWTLDGTRITDEYGTSLDVWNGESGKVYVVTADVDIITYSVTYNLAGGVNDSSNPLSYTVLTLGGAEGSLALAEPTKGEVLLSYTTNSDGSFEVTREAYTFLGWYTDLNYENEVTAITLGLTTLYAKWSQSTTTTTTTEPYVRDGDTVYFGSYPQTKVTDTSIISALGGFDASTWTSYGYYVSGSVSNYMYYIDKEYGGERYRGVYFTSYRPYNCSNSSGTGSYQYNNGYNTSTVYWFRYEPIAWDIVEEADGKATLVADLILDSQQYDYDGSYSNNYAESTIRAWLNETFYNTAFNELQQAIIQTVEVDNSVASTGHSSNPYACENTNDKIFLMSYVEATTWFTSSSARRKQGSDYAKSQGLHVSTSSSYSGNSALWLRSPYYDSSNDARYVYGGGISYYNVHRTDLGVLPALVIEL